MQTKRAVVLGGLLVAAAAASAQNYQFLKDSPVSRFNDEDMRRYRDAAVQALETPGQPVPWSNDKTGSGGTLTANAAERTECRTLTIDNHHKKLSAKSNHHVCKIDGKWKADH